LLQKKKSQKEIADAVGKDKSVISRELKRNGNRNGYHAHSAQMYADERKERFQEPRKWTECMKRKIIKELTEEQWSPEQIRGKALRDGIAMVSVERIYQLIRYDKKQGGTLYKHLRHRLKHRKRPAGGKKVLIPDKVFIDQRPAIINNKERFGDWEIDTMVGANHQGAILTATERKTGFLLMKKLAGGKDAKALAKDLFAMLLPYKNAVLSITSDNGSEFFEHKKLAKLLDTEYYFAHPFSSWERGLNEYTNGLIRQYIPKKHYFTEFSDQEILNIQHKINRRPRKLLNFDNPKNIFFRYLNAKVAFNT
jgi:IS30 family transposase